MKEVSKKKKICDYGCGNRAKWIFENGKVCCSKSHSSCPNVKTGPKRTYPWSKSEFLSAWNNGDSISGAAQILYNGDKINGGRRYHRTKKYAKKLNLDIEEKKNQFRYFKSGPRPDKRIDLDKILSGNHSNYQTNNLRKRLFEAGKKQKKCEKCGISEWLGETAPLELHHINGDSRDHRFENLKILCPNCHAQTDNYRKNQKNEGGQKVTSGELVKALKSKNNIRQALLSVGLEGKGGNYKRCKKLIGENNIKFVKDNNNYGEKTSENYTKNKCKDCKKEISRNAKRCKSCAVKHLNNTKIDWPKTEWLENMVEKYSYLALSRRLDVSDNAIRKRIKNH